MLCSMPGHLKIVVMVCAWQCVCVGGGESPPHLAEGSRRTAEWPRIAACGPSCTCSTPGKSGRQQQHVLVRTKRDKPQILTTGTSHYWNPSRKGGAQQHGKAISAAAAATDPHSQARLLAVGVGNTGLHADAVANLEVGHIRSCITGGGGVTGRRRVLGSAGCGMA